MIIDAHAHIFPYFAGIYQGAPLISGKYGSVKNGSKEFQFLLPAYETSSSKWEVLLRFMDINNVSKAVLMPNILYGYHNDYAIEAYSSCPNRFRCIGLVDITKGEQAVLELKQQHDSGNFCGLKIEINSAFEYRRDLNILSTELIPIWEYLNMFSQPVFLHLNSEEDIERINMLVKSYRNICFIICHMGAESTLSNYCINSSNLYRLLEIAYENENIMLETSGMFCTLKEKFPFMVSNEIIRLVYNKLGARRIIWGSDYPGTLGVATYAQMIEQITDYCSFLSNDDKYNIMANNIYEILWDRSERR